VEGKTETFERIPIISKERLAFIDNLHKKESQDRTNKSEAILVSLIDEKNGRRLEYDLKETCTIGRHVKMCDIVLDYDRTVSSRQCKLHLSKGKVYVSDLGGTNSTYLNNHKINEPTKIQTGDVLGFGRVDLIIKINE